MANDGMALAHRKRALARRIRDLAATLSKEETRARMLEHAKALEEDADEIEARARPH